MKKFVILFLLSVFNCAVCMMDSDSSSTYFTDELSSENSAEELGAVQRMVSQLELSDFSHYKNHDMKHG